MPTSAPAIAARFQGIRQRVPAAIARALNRSIASARTAMVAEIAPDLGLRSGDVRDRIRIEEARIDRPVARLYASPKRIPLIEFAARGPEPSRGRGRGVSARIGSGGRGRYPHAFLATMRSGRRGVFTRKTTRRLPITELRGPSIVRVFAKYQQVGLDRAREQLEKNLQSELRFALSRA